jgi:pilus assembly protein Flp/PilA
MRWGTHAWADPERVMPDTTRKVCGTSKERRYTHMLSTLYIRMQELVAQAKARLTDREEGQGMVEYALILVLIAVVVIIILSVVGKQVNNVFSNVSNGLNQ